jgi:ceramide glucosyltransferase
MKMTIADVFWLLCCAGILMTFVELALVWLFVKNKPSGSRVTAIASAGNRATGPVVSVLRPLCGNDESFEQNLASLGTASGVAYEVILSIADRYDPALPVAEKITRECSGLFHLVVGGIAAGLVMNPKVERLIAAQRTSRGDILFISDSNIRLGPEVIARTVQLFEDPRVGCVSNVFIGEGAVSFGSTIESLHLLTLAAPGVVLAHAAGITCVVGKSMAIRREVLDQIGGFEAFAGVLAEDQAMGLAIRKAGYRIELSPSIVKNVTINRSLGQVLARQLRWCQIRYSFSKMLYVAELLANPFAFALLSSLLALTLAPAGNPLLACAPIVALLRILSARILSGLIGADLSWPKLLLAPVHDLLQFGVQFIPFLSKEVVWKTHRARLARGTVLLPTRRRGESLRLQPLSRLIRLPKPRPNASDTAAH